MKCDGPKRREVIGSRDNKLADSEPVIEPVKDFGEAKNTKSHCIILAVAHPSFHKLTLSDLRQMQKEHPILTDIRGHFNPEEARKAGFYWRTL